jgi:hypothetical protein
MEKKDITDVHLEAELNLNFNNGLFGQEKLFVKLSKIYKIGRSRFFEIYKKVFNKWSEIKQNADAEVLYEQSKIQAKKVKKCKVDHIIELENEIDEVKEILKAGYIIRKITKPDGEEVKINEIFGSYALHKIHNIIDGKRQELFKLQGMYAPIKNRVVDENENDLKFNITLNL